MENINMYKKYFLNKNAAFNLAEILLTIAIIGIIAAITLTKLIHSFNGKVLATQLKKAYADLNQASQKFILNNGMSVGEYVFENSTSKALTLFSKEFTSVGRTSSLTWTSVDEEGNSIGAAPYGWKAVKKSSTVENKSNCDNSGFFWDPIGRVISFDDPYASSGYNGPKVCIDINGEKEPNRYGVDYFIFMFTTDGLVIPWGQEYENNPADCSEENPNINCVISLENCKYSSTISEQYACAYYALLNKHPNDETKDYWHDFVNGK